MQKNGGSENPPFEFLVDYAAMNLSAYSARSFKKELV